MWGYISTEASYQLNFNVGFSNTKSDVLVHLAQWQYWWWFWFAFIWSFYYLLINKLIRFRSLKMRPKIVTSYRPHGKWGDFVAAVIPTIWCLNILANSNFILRLIEWQNESSLFTIRVRARQWYWLYKFELKAFSDILSAPKNIGHNRWVLNTFGDLQTSDDYLHILQLRSQAKWLKNYWGELLKEADNLEINNVGQYKNRPNIVDKHIARADVNMRKNSFRFPGALDNIIIKNFEHRTLNWGLNFNSLGKTIYSFLNYSDFIENSRLVKKIMV